MPKITEYKSELPNNDRVPCVFNVRIYDGVKSGLGKAVVIVTDKKSGSSVSSRVEDIAAQVCSRNRIKPAKLVLIEHRVPQANFEETYDLVHLDYNDRERKFKKPAWSIFTKEAVENITGEKI